MYRRLIRFLKKDAYLRNALESGQDVYAAFAAKLFKCKYEDCLEYSPETGEPTPVGQYRRKTAKFILCAMFFSTKRRWHKDAFELINEVPHFIDRLMEVC